MIKHPSPLAAILSAMGPRQFKEANPGESFMDLRDPIQPGEFFECCIAFANFNGYSLTREWETVPIDSGTVRVPYYSAVPLEPQNGA